MIKYKEGGRSLCLQKAIVIQLNSNNKSSNSIKRSSVYKLSREYGIPTGTIYKWIKDLTPVTTEDGKSITPSEIRALEKRIRELEMENEILKKATAIFARKP